MQRRRIALSLPRGKAAGSGFALCSGPARWMRTRKLVLQMSEVSQFTAMLVCIASLLLLCTFFLFVSVFRLLGPIVLRLLVCFVFDVRLFLVYKRCTYIVCNMLNVITQSNRYFVFRVLLFFHEIVVSMLCSTYEIKIPGKAQRRICKKKTQNTKRRVKRLDFSWLLVMHGSTVWNSSGMELQPGVPF